MAYGARLESVLGASPRGFESPILRRFPAILTNGGAFVFPNRLWQVACVNWGAILRVTVSSEPPQGRKAARIRVRCRVRGGSFYFPLIVRTGAEREGKHDERSLRTRHARRGTGVKGRKELV